MATLAQIHNTGDGGRIELSIVATFLEYLNKQCRVFG